MTWVEREAHSPVGEKRNPYRPQVQGLTGLVGHGWPPYPGKQSSLCAAPCQLEKNTTRWGTENQSHHHEFNRSTRHGHQSGPRTGQIHPVFGSITICPCLPFNMDKFDIHTAAITN